MILEGLKHNDDVIIEGESNVRKATISGDKLAKLQYILTKGLYEEPVTAVIAEWTNNAIDSVVQAGKDPMENPAIVTIGRKSGTGQYFFSVRDEGKGLDDDEFENLLMNYLESSKEEDPDSIGCWGLGAKSFLSLERSATFTCIKDGIKRTYLAYEGAEFAEYDLIHQEETNESNGVTAELIIRDYYEKRNFEESAKQKLCYYDTAVLIIDGNVIDNKIHRHELFQWSNLNTDRYMHFSIKDVYYQIDWKKLGMIEIGLPVCLRFGLSSKIKPTPSREGIIWNKDTIEQFKERIGQVADWFVNKYNSSVASFPTLRAALPYIGNQTKKVKVDEKEFDITSLEKISNVKWKEPVVEGITLVLPSFYKHRASAMSDEFTVVGHDNRGTFYRKKLEYKFSSVINKPYDNYSITKTVLVDQNMVGNVAEFLRKKYGGETLYLSKKYLTRRLKDSKHHLFNSGLTSYYELLDLGKYPKESWRARIKEWEMVKESMLSFVIDARKIEESKEYTDWIAHKAEQRKLNIYPSKSSHKVLNKTEGDVTIAYCRPSAVDGKTPVFEKKVYPISQLYKNRYLTLYFEDTSENKTIAAEWFPLTLKARLKGANTSYRLNVALIGKKELTRIPKLHNFKNMNEFKDTHQFSRFVTAIKAQELIKTYDSLKLDGSVVETLAKKYYDDISILRQYVRANYESYISVGLKDSMMILADQYSLYDRTTMVIINSVQKDLERFDFLSVIQKPNTWDSEATKRYKKLVNQILLFRKLYHQSFPEFEIVEAPPLEVMYPEHFTVDGNGELVQVMEEGVEVDKSSSEENTQSKEELEKEKETEEGMAELGDMAESISNKDMAEDDKEEETTEKEPVKEIKEVSVWEETWRL